MSWSFLLVTKKYLIANISQLLFNRSIKEKRVFYETSKKYCNWIW